MNKFLRLGLVLMGVILLNACSKRVIPFESNKRMKEFTPEYADFDYLSARAKVVIEEGSGKITRGTLNLRAKKDSLLWFTISPGLGMEAVRGLISEEKILIKDRIGKEDINMSFEEFKSLYGLNLSLDLFQNILWANPPFRFDYRDRLVKVGKVYELTQVRDQARYFSKVGVSEAKVTELVSNSLDDRGSLLASFANFQNIDEMPFPAETLYKLVYQTSDGSQNTIIHVEWISIDRNSSPLSFPFRY
ncbi:DUF4292 domain-containing protein [Algoriphagus hitonicola]|uniref:DUF4292 domain-containing protein n=1 Tax=Algoriphagus hitonicola TaxID=435880 RepID=A0A1I2P116_9BACT|nr:DUF4292 domain-containing protein [Algoriphagus hitonicola]SFG09728.1 protein of unknown function [Algoriphagus hitonicola]